MRACTFFGNRSCSEMNTDDLREILINLINEEEVNVFYVGNQGEFDTKVRIILRELTKEYSNISCYIILAYMPIDKPDYYFPTIYPNGIEKIPPRFAITWRNNWMLKRSEFVVSYVKDKTGCSYKFTEISEKLGKKVIKVKCNRL